MKTLRLRSVLAVFAFAACAVFFLAFTPASAFEIKPITSPGGIKA